MYIYIYMYIYMHVWCLSERVLAWHLFKAGGPAGFNEVTLLIFIQRQMFPYKRHRLNYNNGIYVSCISFITPVAQKCVCH